MTSTSFEAFRTCNVLHCDLESDVLTSIAFLCSFEDRDCDHKGLETNFSVRSTGMLIRTCKMFRDRTGPYL